MELLSLAGGSFAAALLLYGFALLYGATGHTDLAGIGVLQGIGNPLLRHPVEGNSRVSRQFDVGDRIERDHWPLYRLVPIDEVRQRLAEVEVLQGRRMKVMRHRAHPGRDIAQLRLGLPGRLTLRGQPHQVDPRHEVVMEFSGDAVAFFVLGDQQVATPPLRLGGQAALVPGKDHPHQRNQRAGGDATDDENPGDERGGSVQ